MSCLCPSGRTAHGREPGRTDGIGHLGCCGYSNTATNCNLLHFKGLTLIDTIRLSYPASETLIKIFDKYSERLQKLSPDGEILWEKTYCQNALPSSFSGLRVNLQLASDMQAQGFNTKRNLIFFEFSLQKYQSDTGYNESNTTLENDIDVLKNWVRLLTWMLDYDFVENLFELYRVDIATNFILECGSIPEFLRSLELKFSRHVNGEKKLMRFDGALQYASRWIGKKLYHKLPEFFSSNGYFKKHKDFYNLLAGGADMEKIRALNGGKRLLTDDEMTTLGRTLRFEVEFRRMYLKKHNITKIVDLVQLKERFEKEKQHYMTSKKLTEGLTLSPSEYYVVELCKRHGPTEAKNEYLKTRKERTWYHTKKQLIGKGVYIDSILNQEWRAEIEKSNSFEEFKLIVA